MSTFIVNPELAAHEAADAIQMTAELIAEQAHALIADGGDGDFTIHYDHIKAILAAIATQADQVEMLANHICEMSRPKVSLAA